MKLRLLASLLLVAGCPDEDPATQITLEVDVANATVEASWPASYWIELEVNRFGDTPALSTRFQLGDPGTADAFPFTVTGV